MTLVMLSSAEFCFGAAKKKGRGLYFHPGHHEQRADELTLTVLCLCIILFGHMTAEHCHVIFIELKVK